MRQGPRDHVGAIGLQAAFEEHLPGRPILGPAFEAAIEQG